MYFIFFLSRFDFRKPLIIGVGESAKAFGTLGGLPRGFDCIILSTTVLTAFSSGSIPIISVVTSFSTDLLLFIFSNSTSKSLSLSEINWLIFCFF